MRAGGTAREEKDAQRPREEEDHIYPAVRECYDDGGQEEGIVSPSPFFNSLAFCSVFPVGKGRGWVFEFRGIRKADFGCLCE